MEILFESPDLREAILLGRPHRAMSAPLAARARYVVALLRAMPDVRTLQNWKSVRFQPCQRLKGVHQIAVQDRHHFLARLDETLPQPTLTIIALGLEPHETAGELAHETV